MGGGRWEQEGGGGRWEGKEEGEGGGDSGRGKVEGTVGGGWWEGKPMKVRQRKWVGGKVRGRKSEGMQVTVRLADYVVMMS